MHLELIVIKFFDLHCDTLTEIFDRGTVLSDKCLAVNTAHLKRFQTFVENFAVFIDDRLEFPKERYKSVLEYGKKALKRAGFEDFFSKSADSNCNKKAMLSLEGGAMIDSLECVEHLALDGIKTVSLCWNYQNRLASGALCEGGLTAFGREVINKMNSLNMVLDVSHLNKQSFYDSIEIAERVVATHSGCDFLTSNKRNLDLEQMTLLKQKNAVIGLCFYAEFLGRPVIESFKNTVFKLLDKGFLENIAIGSDFDGALMDEGLSNVADVPALFDKLKNDGIPLSILGKIFYKNALKFYSKF